MTVNKKRGYMRSPRPPNREIRRPSGGFRDDTHRTSGGGGRRVVRSGIRTRPRAKRAEDWRTREAPRDLKFTCTLRRARLDSILRDGAEERGDARVPSRGTVGMIWSVWTDSGRLEGHDGHPGRRAQTKVRRYAKGERQ